MLTGSDVRQYRRAIRLNQVEFARQWGVAQSTLSMMEGGRTPVSQDHLDSLTAEFPADRYKPGFKEFLADFQRGAAQSQAALTTSDSHHATLTVWKWEDGFDLSRRPAADLAVDLITVRGLTEPAIALQMPNKTRWWHKGEVIVFERCRREDVQEDDICLAQLKTERSKGSRTMIAVSHLSPAKRGKALQLEPLTPSGPIVAPEGDSLIAILRAVYRARHLKS